ncbi:unnamed protein product [Didymodactylos carnosus]|uniref:oleoyl-[acyl-carrier-protein] hydrolase n=1 Tax=Didymodactylos carnosus TaxID=1234261 RepID=A0A815UBN6_9BILA|nr:unnamed protein product [Didymodactylos carnosus]CAF4377380.1 unnamed protein product [Didymodactylos carnosus]
MFSDLVCNSGTILISGEFGIGMSKWMIKERGVKRIVIMLEKSAYEIERYRPDSSTNRTLQRIYIKEFQRREGRCESECRRIGTESIEQNNSELFSDWLDLKQIAEQYHAFIEIIRTDITEFDQVLQHISRINQDHKHPVRGIIHIAMVLHDSLVINMTEEMLSKAMKPKICGALNLHYASVKTLSPLNFFITLSSVSNHAGIIKQSNYNAGNNFLDAISHWRFYCKKLPSLSVSLPIISEDRYVHKKQNDYSVQGKGPEFIPAIYAFKMIEQLYIEQQTITVDCCSTPIILAMDWRTFLRTKQRSLTRLINIAEQYMKDEKVEEEDEMLIDHKVNELKSIDLKMITNKIHIAVSKLFGASSVDRIDLNTPLSEQGMDSLTAVEVHNWSEKEMTINIPIVELLQGMSVNDLGSYVHSKLINRHSAASLSNNNNETKNSLLSKEQDDILDGYTATSLLVPLYSSHSSKHLLFCIHGVVGFYQTFIQFAHELTKIYEHDCPSIYAFQASGYKPDEPFIDTIQMIAEEYILQMKRLQPIGPYHIAAYSFGGLIAYEIVRQLHKNHEETVKSLILFDPLSPNDKYVSLVQETTMFEAFYIIYHYLLDEDVPYDSVDEILKLPEQQRNEIENEMMKKVLPALGPLISSSHDKADANTENQKQFLDRILQIIGIHAKANRNYTINFETNLICDKKLVNNVIMFSVLENSNSEYTSKRQFKNQHQIWKSLLPHLHVEIVQANHGTLLQEASNVNYIVRKLKSIDIL